MWSSASAAAREVSRSLETEAEAADGCCQRLLLSPCRARHSGPTSRRWVTRNGGEFGAQRTGGGVGVLDPNRALAAAGVESG
jgi:hypothetical protein